MIEQEFEIIERINSNEAKVRDPLGRIITLSVPEVYNIGQAIKVVNGIVVGTIEKVDFKIFVG